MNVPPAAPVPAPFDETPSTDEEEEHENTNGDLKARAEEAFAKLREKTRGHRKRTQACQEVFDEELRRNDNDSELYRIATRKFKPASEDAAR